MSTESEFTRFESTGRGRPRKTRGEINNRKVGVSSGIPMDSGNETRGGTNGGWTGSPVETGSTRREVPVMKGLSEEEDGVPPLLR